MDPEPLPITPSAAVTEDRYAGEPVSALPARTVSRLTGMSVRQLRYLAQADVITPSVRHSAGPGSEALYAPGNLFELMVVEKVRSICGQEYRTERLRRIVDALAGYTPTPDQQLVIDGSSVWMHHGPVADVLRRFSAALVIDLDGVHAEFNELLRPAAQAPAALAA